MFLPLQSLSITQVFEIVGKLIERPLHLVHLLAKLCDFLAQSPTSRARNSVPRNSSKSCFHTAEDLPSIVHGATG